MGPKSRKQMLTAREKEIAGMICQGKTNRTIAQELFLSVDTVHTHRKHIYRKLDVHNVASLVQMLLVRKI